MDYENNGLKLAIILIVTIYLFTKLSWPGNSTGSLQSWSQTATCSLSTAHGWELHTVSFIAGHQARKLRIPIVIVFGLTQPRIESEFTVSVADAQSTRPLIDNYYSSQLNFYFI